MKNEITNIKWGINSYLSLGGVQKTTRLTCRTGIPSAMLSSTSRTKKGLAVLGWDPMLLVTGQFGISPVPLAHVWSSFPFYCNSCQALREYVFSKNTKGINNSNQVKKDCPSKWVPGSKDWNTPQRHGVSNESLTNSSHLYIQLCLTNEDVPMGAQLLSGWDPVHELPGRATADWGQLGCHVHTFG